MDLPLFLCHMRFNEVHDTLYHIVDRHAFKLCWTYICINFQATGIHEIGEEHPLLPGNGFAGMPRLPEFRSLIASSGRVGTHDEIS